MILIHPGIPKLFMIFPARVGLYCMMNCSRKVFAAGQFEVYPFHGTNPNRHIFTDLDRPSFIQVHVAHEATRSSVISYGIEYSPGCTKNIFAMSCVFKMVFLPVFQVSCEVKLKVALSPRVTLTFPVTLYKPLLTWED
jgi:hypothetical protein